MPHDLRQAHNAFAHHSFRQCWRYLYPYLTAIAAQHRSAYSRRRSVRSCSRPISPSVQVLTTRALNVPRAGERAGGLQTLNRSRTRSLKLHIGLTFRRCPRAGLRRWPRAPPLLPHTLRTSVVAASSCCAAHTTRPLCRPRAAERTVTAHRGGTGAAAHRRQRRIGATCRGAWPIANRRHRAPAAPWGWCGLRRPAAGCPRWV